MGDGFTTEKAWTLSNGRGMSNRKSIDVEGFSHGANPIPAASRVGNVIMTGAISGLDPATGKIPDDPKAQVAQAFVNLEKILKAGGASLADVVKIGVIVKSLTLREEINIHWLKAFPDEHSRPARHTTQYDHFAGVTAIQLDATAVIS
jgi:enamine deaminase RidA (YjgF/YER057c/UK114 family)